MTSESPLPKENPFSDVVSDLTDLLKVLNGEKYIPDNLSYYIQDILKTFQNGATVLEENQDLLNTTIYDHVQSFIGAVSMYIIESDPKISHEDREQVSLRPIFLNIITCLIEEFEYSPDKDTDPSEILNKNVLIKFMKTINLLDISNYYKHFKIE